MRRLGCPLLLATALLAGCGGDSPRQENGSSPPPSAGRPAPTLSLDSTNFLSATRLAFNSTEAAVVTAVSPLVLLESLAGVPFPVAPPERASLCPGGGSIVDRLEDNDSDGRISAGDRHVTRYVACRFGGAEFNSEQIVEIRQLSWNGRDTHWVAHVTRSDQPPTAAPPPVPAPGTVIPAGMEAAFDIEYEHTPDFERQILTGGSMTVSGPFGPDAASTDVLTLTDVLADVRWDRTAGRYDVLLAARIDSDSLGGSFDFAVRTPFTGELGSYPSAGLAILSGAAGSSVRIAEQDAAVADPLTVTVQLGGEGTPDGDPVTLPWTQLAQGLIFGRSPLIPN